MIETMRIWRMTEALDLTEEQVSKFFPRLKDLEKIREGHQRERHSILREINNLLENGEVGERDLKERIAALESEERRFVEERERLRTELRSILTIEQQARFLVFQEEFERELREMIREARRREPSPPRR
jgi:Spy/CpxP family protein refolding chaperone